MTTAPRDVLLAPTDHHVETALTSFAGADGKIARTLKTFVRDALARLAPDVRLAAPAASRLAAREVLGASGAQAWGGRFAGVHDEPAARVAFVEAVDRSVGRLRRAGARSSDLRALSAPRARMLADVMDGVDVILAEVGLVDERRAGTELAGAIRRSKGEGLELHGGRAQVSGVLSWEGGDLAWLEALHSALAVDGGGVSIGLPRFGGEADLIEPIAEPLERRWSAWDDAPEIVWHAATARPADLVVDAKDDEGEARAIAAAVASALSEGVPPERVVIVVPDLDETALEPLRAALSDARVPWSEPRGRPPAASPEARAALGLLAIAAGPILRDTIIEVLRAPGLHAGTWTEHGSEVEARRRATELAHRLRDVPVNVDRTGKLFVEALTMAVAGRPRDAWMPRALSRLLESTARLGSTTTRGEAVARVLELFDHLKLGQPSAEELGSALSYEGRGGGALGLRALGDGTAAIRALREAATAIGDAARDLDRSSAPAAIVEIALEMERAAGASVADRGGARRAGAVRVARPGEIAALAYDRLILTRTSADAYGGRGAIDSIFPDDLAAELPLSLRPAGARERDAIAKAELAWALAGAARVTITRSTADGEDLGPPHPLVREALLQGAVRRIEPASRLSGEASKVSARSVELAGLAAGRVPTGSIAARTAIERARTQFFLDTRAPAGDFTGRVPIADAAVRAHLAACVGGSAPDHSIAVTAIERAAACAFAGFAGRVLRVRKAEDTSEAADPRERGNLVHRALHAAFEGVRGAPPASERRLLLAVARGAAERAVDFDLAASPLRREARAQAVDDAVRAVARSLDAADPVAFALAERRFGASELPPWQALELAGDDEEGSVFVDGQIDRVDRTLDGRRARVVDYKTGAIPEGRARERTAFQLPLYAELVRRATGATEIDAVYVRIPQGGAMEVWPRDQADQRLSDEDRAAKASDARRVVLGLWRGEVAPRPYHAKVCARCDARDVCRRPDVAPVDDDAEGAP